MSNKKLHIRIREIFNGDIWTKEFIRQQYPLFGLICFLIMLSIFNGYKCEQQHIRISQLQEQLDDLQHEYITQEATLVGMSRQSNVSKQLEEQGSSLKDVSVAPTKLNP